ncbi:MAG: hypothetical protein WD055_00045 [Candidatus Dependentiae bacterium]
MKKNILIISLLLANIVTLLLLYNVEPKESLTLPELLILIKKKAGKELQDFYLDKDEMYQDFKKGILNYYKPSAANCGATVSLNKQGRFAGTSMIDMACLIADQRKIAWSTPKDVAGSLIEQMIAFEYVSQIENIQEIGGISYRPEGKRNALLLSKIENAMFKLVENIGPYTKNDSKQFGSYLIGTLLGYDPADIAFFYQRPAFRDFLAKENQNIEIPFSYADFSPELKKRFDAFIEQDWPDSEAYKKYVTDIAQADDWLKEQSVYSEEELLEQVKMLEKANN